MHGTPAAIDDGLGGKFLRDWHRWMHDTTCEAVQWARIEMEIQGSDPDTLAYVDLDGGPPPDDAIVVAVQWNGFPLRVRARHHGLAGPAAWAEAETAGCDERDETVFGPDDRPLDQPRRLAQDEYLEWFGDRVEDDDRAGIRRVHVTCEGPEYWELLAQSGDDGRAKVHALYESLLGCSIPKSDLFYPADAYVLDGSTRMPVGGRYDRFNIWNTHRGAIHLTHANNTLGAEVNLATRAAIPRHGHDTPANDTSGITRCGGWGAPDRDSDPHIGAAANAFVRNGYRISLTDPVGPYISDLTATSLRLPDPSVVDEGRAEIPNGVSSELADWWRVVRPTDPGTSSQRRILRAVFEPPEGVMYVRGDRRRPFRVSDLYVRDDRVTHAAALATEVRMQLFVTAWKATSHPVPDELACFDPAWSDEIEQRAHAHCHPMGVAPPPPIGAAMSYTTSRV
ncbi:MAG: hypothetical protein ACJ77I_09550 [Chloroflexota bacterium]